MINILKERGINYERLPQHIQDGMKSYVEEGIEPGSFCRACLEDKLVAAFGAADDTNINCMKDMCMWLYNDCPGGARGSEKAVEAWMERGGMKGLLEEREKSDDNL